MRGRAAPAEHSVEGVDAGRSVVNRLPAAPESVTLSEGDRSTSSTVAVVLRRRGKIGLFKRSADVSHDGGLWHCITGYLEPSTPPLAQAMQELFEETGLTVADIDDIHPGPVLELPGDDGGTWVVHTFSAQSSVRTLSLNWEHDAYRWVKPHRVRGFLQVHWLREVMDATEGGRDEPRELSE